MLEAEIKRVAGKLRITIYGSRLRAHGRLPATEGRRILQTVGRLNATARDERRARAALDTLGIKVL